MRRLSGAVGLNVASQGGAALLGLLLVKLSVALFSVPAFGATALLLGLQVLARNALFNPLLNLAIYQYPEALRVGRAEDVYRSTQRASALLALLAIPLFAGLIKLLAIPAEHLVLSSVMLSGLVASEVFKTAKLNLLHVQNRTGHYAAWTLADAASKPMFVFILGGLLSQRTPLALLAGHLGGSLLTLMATLLMLRRPLPSDDLPSSHPAPSSWAWVSQHRGFLFPLAALGLVGWLTGLSDRFFVNAFLGPRDAGLYAGIYGIFSLPFILLSTAMTLATRPPLLHQVAADPDFDFIGEHARHLRLLVVMNLLLALALLLLRHHIIRLALAGPFLAASHLVPGILIGNAILALGTYLELPYYLAGRTDLVLVKQLSGALCAIGTVLLLVPRFGSLGAAWACPVYGAAEFGVGWWLLKRARRQRSTSRVTSAPRPPP